MSRIRSIHPGIASDETYMTMSMAAKAVWPILWTECDDHGVFEWKPIVLKARILPADTVDFASILDEYVTLGCVLKFEAGGKAYGLVRNFGRYQRPKHPSYRHPFPPEVREFAAFKADAGVKATGHEGDGHGSPTENRAQMKEEGGSRREEEKSDAIASSFPPSKRASAPAAGPIRDAEFLVFYEAFPRKSGIDDAEDEFVRAVERGSDPALIVAAAKDYARKHQGDDEKFVTSPAKWLRDQRWREYKPVQISPTEERRFIRTDDPAWSALAARWKAEKGRPPPISNSGWNFPVSWLPKADAA